MKLFGKIVIAIALLFTSSSGYTQDLVRSLSKPYEMAWADPFGQFYLVNEKQITKIDSLGQILSTFSDPGLGNVSWMDTSDPFRILVYYRTFNQIIFLDRTLSSIGAPINLDDLQIFLPAGICRSSMGGFWIIDQTNNSLIHLNNDLKSKVNIILTGLVFEPQQSWLPMMEWKERLYICNPEKDIFLFDLYGTHLKNIPVKAASFSFLDNSLLFIGKEKIFQYSNYPGVLSEPQNMDLPQWEKLIISKNHALIYNQLGWHLHRLKKTL